MGIRELAQQVRSLKAEHPRAASMDWHDCAYLVLCDAFQTEPTEEEVDELAKAAKVPADRAKDFFEGWDGQDSKGLQTGGGRRVVRKSEPLGG